MRDKGIGSYFWSVIAMLRFSIGNEKTFSHSFSFSFQSFPSFFPSFFFDLLSHFLDIFFLSFSFGIVFEIFLCVPDASRSFFLFVFLYSIFRCHCCVVFFLSQLDNCDFSFSIFSRSHFKSASFLFRKRFQSKQLEPELKKMF